MELKQELGTIVGRRAQIATDQETVQALGAVRPGSWRGAPNPWRSMGQMVVVHAKARNNRDLNAASIQISRESMIDKNGAISRASMTDKNGAIRLLTELCSSYRLLNVPAG
ncbi:hypothetical protein L2E82_20997 [Cichorium intybus]|uniref:Uncharacterized protein n=1 Tax=Cichorium intybus TaxID=13427 RepID=A0ACB9DVM2_CICIN|nr:hypothetical protein L2E82_20997 [Cichorium intybus]